MLFPRRDIPAEGSLPGAGAKRPFQRAAEPRPPPRAAGRPGAGGDHPSSAKPLKPLRKRRLVFAVWWGEHRGAAAFRAAGGTRGHAWIPPPTEILRDPPRIASCNLVCVSPSRVTPRCVNARRTNPYQIPTRAVSLLTKLIPRKAPVCWPACRKAIINRLSLINTDLNKMKREPQRRLPNTFLHTSQVQKLLRGSPLLRYVYFAFAKLNRNGLQT